MNVKTKKRMDDVKEDRGRVMNIESEGNLDEYEEQYNANHNFAIF